jgi:hypothetical protein
MVYIGFSTIHGLGHPLKTLEHITHGRYVELVLHLAELLCTMGPSEFCVLGKSQILYANEVARNRDGHLYSAHLLCPYVCSIVPLDFTYKTSSKIQLLSTSRRQQQSIKLSLGLF